MWARKFKDYPTDSPTRQEQVEPGKGIIGCEMHEPFGWGHSFHEEALPKPKKKSFLKSISHFFRRS